MCTKMKTNVSTNRNALIPFRRRSANTPLPSAKSFPFEFFRSHTVSPPILRRSTMVRRQVWIRASCSSSCCTESTRRITHVATHHHSASRGDNLLKPEDRFLDQPHTVTSCETDSCQTSESPRVLFGCRRRWRGRRRRYTLPDYRRPEQPVERVVRALEGSGALRRALRGGTATSSSTSSAVAWLPVGVAFIVRLLRDGSGAMVRSLRSLKRNLGLFQIYLQYAAARMPPPSRRRRRGKGWSSSMRSRSSSSVGSGTPSRPRACRGKSGRR